MRLRLLSLALAALSMLGACAREAKGVPVLRTALNPTWVQLRLLHSAPSSCSVITRYVS